MFNNIIKDVATLSRKTHVIVCCLIFVPTLMGLAWLCFPFLEERNLGFPVWHGACLLGFLVGGLGIVCWTAEKLSPGTSPSWVALLMLTGYGLGTLFLRIFGDFYWAFDRGYFLG